MIQYVQEMLWENRSRQTTFHRAMTLDWSWWARISHVERHSRREHQGVPSAGGVSIWHGDPAIPLFGIYPSQTCTSLGKGPRMFAYSIVCSKGETWKQMGSGWVTSLGVQWLVGTLPFYCRGHGFDPWSEQWDPTCHVVWSKKKFFNEEKKKRGHWLNNLKSIHAFGLLCNNLRTGEIKICSYMKTSKILLHAKKQSAEHSKYSENMHQTDFGDFL